MIKWVLKILKVLFNLPKNIVVGSINRFKLFFWNIKNNKKYKYELLFMYFCIRFIRAVLNYLSKFWYIEYLFYYFYLPIFFIIYSYFYFYKKIYKKNKKITFRELLRCAMTAIIIWIIIIIITIIYCENFPS